MIYVCGSINLDRVYRVKHLPSAGETLAATEYWEGLGGKGANQAIAAAKAGAELAMIGAVGPDGHAAIEALRAAGVQTDAIDISDQPTGHAVILLEAEGENRIIIVPGANHTVPLDKIQNALSQAQPGDLLLLQNEISQSAEAARMGQQRGMQVIYSAAPFDAEAVAEVLPHCDLLAMNEAEYAALTATDIQVTCPCLVTLGADGVKLIAADGQSQTRIKAPQVTPVDTTGAGDCFIGNFAAALAQGRSRETAMARATKAAALQVTRHGASLAMPTASEVDLFQP